MLSFSEAVRFLDSLVNYERSDRALRRKRLAIGLTRVREVLEALGRPQDACPVIHIAGTNGKGSTAAMAAAILQAAGLRVGLYTSPHLADVRERIRLDGRPIPEADFARAIERVRPVVERAGPAAGRGGGGVMP